MTDVIAAWDTVVLSRYSTTAHRTEDCRLLGNSYRMYDTSDDRDHAVLERRGPLKACPECTGETAPSGTSESAGHLGSLLAAAEDRTDGELDVDDQLRNRLDVPEAGR